MHWQLAEVDMARRAGVVPFALSGTNVDPPPHGLHHRVSPSRGHQHHHPHHHSQSQGSLSREMAGAAPSPRYGRGGGPPPTAIPPPSQGGRSIAARRESGPLRPPPTDPAEAMYYGHSGAVAGLAPIQTVAQQRREGMLPGVAELTTGVSPYRTPAYSTGVASASPVPSQTASPGPLLPGLGAYPGLEQAGGKRRASPELGPRETRRRHLDPRYDDGGGGGGMEGSHRM